MFIVSPKYILHVSYIDWCYMEPMTVNGLINRNLENVQLCPVFAERSPSYDNFFNIVIPSGLYLNNMVVLLS